MIIGLSGLGCADCFGTCGDGIAGLGDTCGPSPSDAVYQAAGKTHAQWLVDYYAWVNCVNGSQTLAQTQGVNLSCPANQHWEGGTGSGGCVGNPVVPTSCGPGYVWDGLAGLIEGLSGCKPTQATLDAQAAQAAALAAQQEAARTSAATLLAQQKAAQQKAIDDAAVAAAYQARVTAAKAACPSGYEWDGVLNGLSGCKAIAISTPVVVKPIPIVNTNVPVVPVVVPTPVVTTGNTPVVYDTVAQPFDFTTFMSGTYFGVPTWMLLVGAGGGLYLATKGGR